jgi:hypothetical protein
VTDSDQFVECPIPPVEGLLVGGLGEVRVIW